MTLVDYLIQSDHTQLLDELAPSENSSKLRPQSHRIVLWRCPNGHEYEAAVYSRTAQNSACPYCSGLKAVNGANDIPAVRPDLLQLWDSEKNGSADGIMPGSHKRKWWKCENGHSWQQRVYSVANGSGCPYCSGYLPIAGETDIATTHPQLAAEWDHEKNDLTPQEVSAGSEKKGWWKCPEGHSYQSAIFARAAGTGCPYCAGKKVLRGFNDLATTDPDLTAEWADERLNPAEVNRGSHRAVRWRCALGHEYESPVFSRVAGNGCPYCAGRKVLAGFNDLATTHPKVAAQWEYTLNGELTPEMVTKGSNKKVWWKCSEGHVWHAVVFSRTRAKASDCPVCAGTVKRKRRDRYDDDFLSINRTRAKMPQTVSSGTGSLAV